MTKRYYCTYFDKNYLVRGIAQITSLIEHENNELTIYVVCLDEITRAILNKINMAKVILIPLHDIEYNDKELAEARANRNMVEYFWTLTPTIILRILERNPHIDILTYVDADMYFYSSPAPIYDELGDASVLIHGHRFPELYKSLDIHGIYNVGLLCFRNDARAYNVLDWWRARCNEWCYARVEDGKYGDQLYLNDWPDRFEGLVVLQHIGAGTAPWNLIQYRIEKRPDGSVYINDLPLVFFHFHAFNIISPQIFIPVKHNYYLSEPSISYCYYPYVQQLIRIMGFVNTISPLFDCTDKEIFAHDDQTFIFASAAAPILDDFIHDQRSFAINNRWICSCGVKLVEQSKLLASGLLNHA